MTESYGPVEPTREGARDSGPPIYEELHRFVSKDWAWVLFVFGVLCAVVFFGVVCAFTAGGILEQPVFWLGSLLSLFGMSVPAFWKMVVRVDTAGVSMRMYPFLGSRVRHADIAEIGVREIRVLREYGGSGIRYSPWAGWGWIGTWSRKGVQLELHDGKRILIASRAPEKLEAAIRAHLSESRLDDDEGER